MSERQASTFRKGQFTDSHVRVLSTLSQNHVIYRAEEVIHIWGVFDHRGSILSCKADVVIIDPNYSCGIIEIEGAGSNSKDNETRDKLLLKAGFEWIEHVPNSEVETVMEVLEKHRKEVSEWP